jgi:hypothetical protein
MTRENKLDDTRHKTEPVRSHWKGIQAGCLQGHVYKQRRLSVGKEEEPQDHHIKLEHPKTVEQHFV